MATQINEYNPWTGELAVQPVECPCCGSKPGVWMYTEERGGEVHRVVMCGGGELDDERLPMMLSSCPLDMPPEPLYCQTARRAVQVWNIYAEALNKRKAEIAAAKEGG